MNIEELFEIQKKDDSLFYNIPFDNKSELKRFIRERSLDIYSQLGSLLNMLNWKLINMKDKGSDIENAKEQIADSIKFLIGFYIAMDGDADSFVSTIHRKSFLLKEYRRMNSEDLSGAGNVLVFDIDGVISDYDKTFFDFLREENILNNDSNLKDRTTYSYSTFLNMDNLEYEKIQRNFIYSDYYINMNWFSDTISVINKLYDLGYKIALITARPFDDYKIVSHSTIAWLRFSGVKYHKVFFAKDKADVIVKNFESNDIVLAVDDRDKHAIELSHLGIVTLLLDKPYNRGIDTKDIEGLFRIKSINELFKFIKEYEDGETKKRT